VTVHAVLFAFGWFPEIKGITVVLIAVAVLIGGSYLIVATNVGARLGMLVVLAALFGWMASMGVIWWSYGIGLKGKDPSWKPKEIVRICTAPCAPVTDLSTEANAAIAQHPELLTATITNRVAGWIRLADDNPGRGQAVASADEIVQTAKDLKAADADGAKYLPVAAYDYGGSKWPNKRIHNVWKFGDVNLDYFAFFHHTHYALVEFQPTIAQKTEPGKAPPVAKIDPTQPTHFVLMVRDLGTRRQPAAFITIGSSLLFLLLCLRLHQRDKTLAANRAGASRVPVAAAAD
jgi:hypothetical protein